MMNWQAIILVIGAYQGLLAGILLLLRKGSNRRANQLLGLLLFGMGLAVFHSLLLFYYRDAFQLVFSGTIGLLSFCYGPVVYFYIRAYISKDFSFQRLHLWHLSPLLLVVLYQQLVFPADIDLAKQMMERFREGIAPPWYVRILGLTILLHVFSYLFLSIRLVRRYYLVVRESVALEDQLRSRWISWILVVLLFPILSAIFASLILGPVREQPIPAFAATLMILVVYILYLRRPEILEGIPPDLQVKEGDLVSARYESSSLTQDQKQRYYQQLLQYMETHQAHRKQDLNLTELAEKLNINSKYLSQIINEMGQQNFVDFINGYRIREAQKLLLSSQHQHFTIVAIAQEVGFRSRSAFYSAFRKVTGQTPTEYKSSKQ